MQNEKISEIIAHFIGLFEMTTEEMRLRAAYAEAPRPGEDAPPLPDHDASTPDFASDLLLLDYEPDAPYRPLGYGIGHVRARDVGRISEEDVADPRRPSEESRPVEDALDRLAAIASKDIEIVHFREPHVLAPEERELAVLNGPGSTISHMVQVNALQDDDYLNMTDGPIAPRDTTFVTARLAEFSAQAEVFTPFSNLHRTDTYEGVQKITGDMQSYAKEIEDTGQTSLGSGATQDFVLADKQIEGIYVNGELTTEAPQLDEHVPDRGIAAPPPEEPEKSETSLEQRDPAAGSLVVATGANVVTNVVSVINTGVLAPVTAVMGDYHQVDAISQSYVYSDNDEIADTLKSSGDSAAPETAAYNIALFHISSYGTADPEPAATQEPADPVFPTAWRVSVVEGDVSFVQWIEQYHFISDNDTMTVTSSGTETTVLTGGNAAVNFAAYFGMGMQYDLVIVGGDILDVNSITQIALLYDNDWVRADDIGGSADIQTGNNLIWNQASIHNIGAGDRFEAMPDYIVETRQAIDDRDPLMPEGLSSDANFQGYTSLNVLYITGNLYDMAVIKQVAILGDSDDVTHAASELLADNPDASIVIDTGSNAIVNIAEIADYDSFGQTTYLAGQLYSDAILIQGGLLEDDTSQPEAAGQKLANEVIAFLDDDSPEGDGADGMINAGHDLSWSSAHPADVMQTVVA
ncbi:hypothetical protein [Rhizobium binxianense]